MSEAFFSTFTAKRRAAIEAALLPTFGTVNISDFSLLAGGLSAAAVYRIVIKDKPYVLKLANPMVAAPKATNLFLAAKAGIAPPLHFEDPITGISISAYIEGKPLRSVFSVAQLMKELAVTAQVIHTIPLHTKGPDLFSTLDSLIGQFKQSNMLNGAAVDQCFEGYENIKTLPELRKDHDLVCSHNDLNPNNLLCDGQRIWIIDWDASYLNSRYVDLANLANFFAHSEDQEHLLLYAYFNGDLDQQKKSRLFVMRQLSRIIYALLMFQLASQSKPIDYAHSQQLEGIDLGFVFAQIGSGSLSLGTYEGQLMYGKALLNEAVKQMNSPRWLASVAALG